MENRHSILSFAQRSGKPNKKTQGRQSSAHLNHGDVFLVFISTRYILSRDTDVDFSAGR